MNLKDIFKMEMYKNFRDKTYIIMVCILAAGSTLSSIITLILPTGRWGWGSWGLTPFQTFLFNIQTIISIFLMLAVWLFILIYPFHLMNTDYKNKVISLMFASGVDRIKYYFVKVGATILSTLLAIGAIFLVSTLLSILFNLDDFNYFISLIFEEFQFRYVGPIFLMIILAIISNTVSLSTAVIMTKGKLAGIFLQMGFTFLFSIFLVIAMAVFLASANHFILNPMTYIHFINIILVLWIILGGLIGISILKKQDL